MFWVLKLTVSLRGKNLNFAIIFFCLLHFDTICSVKPVKKRPLSKRPKISFEDQLGDNCIQNFHLGRYIVGYTVGNLVLRRCVSRAFKRDFRAYFRRYTSPNENFEYGYPHSNALLTFSLQKDSENVLCCAYTSSDASCIKPLASCIYSLVNQ